jgi:hypothetical protein
VATPEIFIQFGLAAQRMHRFVVTLKKTLFEFHEILFHSRAVFRFALPLLALPVIAGCTETVGYRQPAPPPPAQTTVIVQRPPSPAPPVRVEVIPAMAGIPSGLGPRALALERLSMGMDPWTLSPGIIYRFQARKSPFAIPTTAAGDCSPPTLE